MRRQEERAVDRAQQGGKLMLFNLFLLFYTGHQTNSAKRHLPSQPDGIDLSKTLDAICAARCTPKRKSGETIPFQL